MYALNILNGLANSYLLLIYWGFSAGTTNYMPYVILIASLLLHFVCSGISLFRSKIGAAISLACALPILFWQSQLMGDAFSGSLIVFIVFFLLVGLCWMLIFKAIKIIINKDVYWKSPGMATDKKWKLFFSILPFSVLLLYLL